MVDHRRHGKNIMKPAKGAQNAEAARQALTRDADGTLRVRMDVLRAPENVYDSDAVAVGFRNGTVSFFFGKADVSGGRLRSRLEVRYPLEAFRDHFLGNSREFHEALRRDLELGVIKTTPYQPIDVLGLSADKEHSLWANFDYLARTGTQASLDFFHLPPGDVVRISKTGSLQGVEIVPAVRVFTTVGELMRLLETAVGLEQEVSAYAPERFGELK